MARKKNSPFTLILLGPCITFGSLVALWKNETRFDYYRVAAKTVEATDLDAVEDGTDISLTGPMDQSVSFSGDYVEQLTGYLHVQRTAEIYAWKKSQGKKGRTNWNRRWMTSLPSNSRNNNLRKELSSREFQPDSHQVGNLQVESKDLTLTDASQNISPNDLTLKRQDFTADGNYFYYRKGGRKSGTELGDERVYWSGVPVPATATWFGRFSAGDKRGVADDSHKRTGMINKIIGDSGLLHHLAGGDRNTALQSLKSHIQRLKWMVRGIGTACTVLGIFLFLLGVFGILLHIPIIGVLAEYGSFIAALLVGIPLAFVVIVVSYLIANPLVPLIVVAVVGGITWWLTKRGRENQAAVREAFESDFGGALNDEELKELEFLELARLAFSDDEFSDDEKSFLRKWAKKHGWDTDKYRAMLKRARDQSPDEEAQSDEDHLTALIRLSLADGNVTRYEMKTIRRTARSVGFDDAKIRALTERVRSAAAKA